MKTFVINSLTNFLPSIYSSPKLFDLILMTMQLSGGGLRSAAEQRIHPSLGDKTNKACEVDIFL